MSSPNIFSTLSKIAQRRFSKYTRTFEPDASDIKSMERSETDTNYENVIRTLIPNNTLNLASTMPYITSIFGNPFSTVPNTTTIKLTKGNIRNSIENIIEETTPKVSLLRLKNNENHNLESQPEECLDQASSAGICDHLIKRSAWSYHTGLNDCSEFAYSGCGSSRNIFWNKKDCVLYCVIKQYNITVRAKDNLKYEMKDINNKTFHDVDDNERIDSSVQKHAEDTEMNEKLKSDSDIEDDYGNNEYDDGEYYYYSNENVYEAEESGQDDAYEGEGKFPPLEIDENTNDAEENLSGYDIDPLHLMPHWDRHNFVYTRDVKNLYKKSNSL